MNNTIKLGLILGVIGIATSLLYKYVIGYDFMFSSKSMLVSLALSLLITILLARKMLRDPEEDRLGYGEAVKKLFLAYLISTLISGIASVALFSNDVEMKNAFTDYSISAAETGLTWGLSMAGASEADIETQLQEHREKVASGEIPEPSFPYKWNGLPMMLFSGAIMAILMALLLALFVREKETDHA